MLVTIVAAVALLVVVAVIVTRRVAGPAGQQWLRWLPWLALAAAVMAAIVLGPATVRDSGWFATVLLGVPVVLAALPPVWDLTVGRAGNIVAWLAAVLALGWAVLLALGFGLALLPAALLMLAAAVARTNTGTPVPDRA